MRGRLEFQWRAAQATNKNAQEGEEAVKSLRILVIAAALAGTQAWAGEKSIKIGVLGDQSGPYSDLGGAGSVLAAQMAADDYGGRALGKPIEIVAADMQNKPDVASSIARRWFDVEGVDAIADVPLTSVELAVQSVAREKKKIVLITAAASADLTGKACSPYTVHWMDDTRALSVGTGRAVVAAGGKQWFFLTPDYAFGAAMERAASAAVVAAGGTVAGNLTDGGRFAGEHFRTLDRRRRHDQRREAGRRIRAYPKRSQDRGFSDVPARSTRHRACSGARPLHHRWILLG
jgi:ABC-type branched-subunit amino acid transport system substrate-binding protein